MNLAHANCESTNRFLLM